MVFMKAYSRYEAKDVAEISTSYVGNAAERCPLLAVLHTRSSGRVRRARPT